MYNRTPRVAYNDQKKSALKRGVEWQFTFEQWLRWWETELGYNWFKLRGHHTGEYVMARNGDKGPYEASNVRCILVENNHNEYNFNKSSSLGKSHRSRLSSKLVTAIYKANGSYKDIAKYYKLDVHSVHRIKCAKCYVAITKGLEKGRSG